MTFTLDTNILVGLVRRYPRDIFESIWDAFETASQQGEICICQAVLREVERGGDDLHAWAKGLDGFVCAATDDELVTVAEIAMTHPDWVRGQKNEADPFVVAHAKQADLVIVTEETAAGPGALDKNLGIPNVASEHEVQCLDFFTFLRDRGWTF